MSDYTCSPQEQSPVYGFLCPETNIFYAFDSSEQYQEFLGWLQKDSEWQPNQPQTTSDIMSDEEMRANAEKSTNDLMEVFQDPVFSCETGIMELEEVDFWY